MGKSIWQEIEELIQPLTTIKIEHMDGKLNRNYPINKR